MEYSIKDKIRVRGKKLFLINRLGGKCAICGKSFNVYDFHHIDSSDKDFEIGSKDFRISKLIKESSKCLLLCKNCHREIHNKYDCNNLTSKQKIKQQMLAVIGLFSCSKCAYNLNLAALDFHHLNPATKKFNLSDAVISRLGLISKHALTNSVKAELLKCTVLCAQCHSEFHYDSKFDTIYNNEILNISKNIREIQPKIDRLLVKEMYESGMLQINIAHKLKASKGTISDILKNLGLTTATPQKIKEKIIVNRRKFDPSIIEATELKSKFSYREIGKLYEVSHIAVYNRFKKMNIN